MPGPNVPFPPMEAELVRELPTGDGWQYEPKWDGFRGVLENDGGELALWSRNERPLLRYFPELRPLGDELLRVGEGFWISPAVRELDAATAWLDRFEAAGLDGVIAKRLGLPYLPGSRDGVVKVKEHKTADCVVVGVRWKEKPARLATLLLGVYREDGGLDYVGSAAVAARKHDEIADRVLPLLERAPDRRFSEPNRWGRGELE